MNKPQRVVTVFGTRPEAIKMAPVLEELGNYPDDFKSILVVTAQHREMLDQVLEQFGLSPDLDLDIMKRGQTLADITMGTLEGLTEYFMSIDPAVVLVHGDTTTTLTAALAAFYLGIPVGHVEAGLRTGNRFLPFPEEMNRRLTDEIAGIFFAPTARAKKRLLEREIPAGDIFVTGNTVVDALGKVSRIRHRFSDERIERFLDGEGQGSFRILFTMHRRESWGEPMSRIFGMLRGFVENDPDVHLIYPVHPNHEIRQPADEILGGHERITLIEALDYLNFLHLMKRCDLIISDSGGVQEEAPSFGKYTLVLREATERPEVVECGFAEVCGTDPDRILEALHRAKPAVLEGKLPPRGVHNPVGDGRAAARTVEFLRYKLGLGERPPVEFEG